MPDQRMCCQKLADLPQSVSPFVKVVALGFYDGPIMGLTECGRCGRVYHFDMLAWDESHDLRVFRLAGLPETAIARLVQALSPYEEPRWPVWAPRWQFPSKTEQDRVDQETKRILQEMGVVECILATEDLSQRILAAKRVSSDELGPSSDWFTFLGLKTQPADYVPCAG